jgi:transcriptional regulator with XRE-family HTH domain
MPMAAQNRLSDQLRAAIKASGMTRYKISQATGIDQAVLSKFMSGTTGLSQASSDAIGELLGLELIVRRKRRVAKKTKPE